MRIEIEKHANSDALLDEMAYVAFNFKKFLKDPTRKVQQMSPLIKKYTLSALVATIVMLACWLLLRNAYFFYLAEVSFILLIFMPIFKIRVRNYLAPYRAAESKKTALEISEKGVSYETAEKTYTNSWDAIFKVLVSDNSITFLPKEASSVCIGTYSAYADQIVEALKEYGKEGLIIDSRTN